VSEKARHEHYVNEVKYNLFLLRALDDNKTKIVKALLGGEVNSIFIVIAEEGDLEKFSILCEDFTPHDIELLKKSDLNISDNQIVSFFGNEHINKELEFRRTREKFIEYCKKQKKGK
jgi:hypothetical protein